MNRTDYSKISMRAYDKVVQENDDLKRKNKKLKTDVAYYKKQLQNAKASVQRAQDNLKKEKEKNKQALDEKDAIIKELKNQLAHEVALRNHDGTNTGLPTSQTPVGKKKHIPNARTKTGRKKGGQKGHKKHAMEKPSDDQIDETVQHEADENQVCSKCGSSNFTATGQKVSRYEIEIDIKVRNVRHEYWEYKCNDCGETFYAPFEPNHKAECQYGSGVQAMILSLANTCNVPMNKVKTFLSGITDGKINPSEGYIAKLQKRGSKGLVQFKEDLKRYMITRLILYWDDTVIMIKTKRGCLRFYGDERISYYTAHETKGMAGLDEDNVLTLLTKETNVMHDHNKVNYNEKYAFRNLECNQHLERDLQKSCDDSHHLTLLELKELISKTIHDRNEVILKGVDHFEEERIDCFYQKVDEILEEAEKLNSKDSKVYGADFEKALIVRVRNFKENYFAWVKDFSLPTTDNLSERGLRTVKSHMKVSGQFDSVKTARYYADIKTYIETCRKNGINEYYALSRLCEGNPVTVYELFPDFEG